MIVIIVIIVTMIPLVAEEAWLSHGGEPGRVGRRGWRRRVGARVLCAEPLAVRVADADVVPARVVGCVAHDRAAEQRTRVAQRKVRWEGSMGRFDGKGRREGPMGRFDGKVRWEGSTGRFDRRSVARQGVRVREEDHRRLARVAHAEPARLRARGRPVARHLYSYGPIKLWLCTVVALYSYCPI